MSSLMVLLFFLLTFGQPVSGQSTQSATEVDDQILTCNYQPEHLQEMFKTFSHRMEQLVLSQFSEAVSQLNQMFDQFSNNQNLKLDQLDRKLDQQNEVVSGINQTLSNQTAVQLDQQQETLSNVRQKIDQVYKVIDKLRLYRLDQQQESLLQINKKFEDLELDQNCMQNVTRNVQQIADKLDQLDIVQEGVENLRAKVTHDVGILVRKMGEDPTSQGQRFYCLTNANEPGIDLEKGTPFSRKLNKKLCMVVQRKL